jgi:drug/metabolite transporter (DMT)-like permease
MMNENVTPDRPAPLPPPPSPAPPPVVAPPVVIQRKSPVAAAILSVFFPGLGHLYLGLYQLAFMIAASFVGLIWLITVDFFGGHLTPALGLGIAFVWFFGLIDSVRRANAINLGYLQEQNPERLLAARVGKGAGSLTWGVILVGLGILWLIDRYVEVDWSFMEEWGAPVAFILLGVLLIVTHVRRKRRENEEGVGMPPRSS